MNQAVQNNDDNTIEKSGGSHQEEICNVEEKNGGNDSEVATGSGQDATADSQLVGEELDVGVTVEDKTSTDKALQ